MSWESPTRLIPARLALQQQELLMELYQPVNVCGPELAIAEATRQDAPVPDSFQQFAGISEAQEGVSFGNGEVLAVRSEGGGVT